MAEKEPQGDPRVRSEVGEGSATQTEENSCAWVFNPVGL